MVKGPATSRSAFVWGLDRTGPAWAARVYPPGGGQDHLGLGSVSSDRILPTLSPGINVLTIHPRYWSFYAWVLDEYWIHKGPKNAATFIPFYRQREALFAFACQLCQAPEHNTLTGNMVSAVNTAYRGIAKHCWAGPRARRVRPQLRIYQGTPRRVRPLLQGRHGGDRHC